MTLEDGTEYYLKPMNCPHHHGSAPGTPGVWWTELIWPHLPTTVI